MTSSASRRRSDTEASAATLISALMSLGRAQRAAAARVAHELDWPRSGVAVARLLAQCGPASLTDIASHLRVDLSVASRQVSTMADAGYVVRTVDAEDRRVRTVELTDAGRTLVADAREQYMDLIDRAFSAWSNEELTEAARTVERLSDTLAADTVAASTPQNQ